MAKLVAKLMVAAGMLALAGCTTNPWVFNRFSTGADDSVAMDATQRTVIVTKPKSASLAGQNRPGHLVCAEPSPDVATALSQSVRAAFEAAAKVGPAAAANNVDAKLSTDFAKAMSQTIAQLGQRTLTVQVLRDTLYRACESYQNGAMSDVSYGLILSRYERLVMTLMSGELVSGAVGGSGATLTGEASYGGPGAGVVQAYLDLSKAFGDAVTAKATADTANTASKSVLKEKKTELEAIEKKEADNVKLSPAETTRKAALPNEIMDAEKDVTAKTDALKKAEATLEGKSQQLEDIRKALPTALIESTKATAAVFAAAGGKPEQIDGITGIYKTFVADNDLYGPLITACVIAMSRREFAEEGPFGDLRKADYQSDEVFRTFCAGKDADSSGLQRLITKAGEVLGEVQKTRSEQAAKKLTLLGPELAKTSKLHDVCMKEKDADKRATCIDQSGYFKILQTIRGF